MIFENSKQLHRYDYSVRDGSRGHISEHIKDVLKNDVIDEIVLVILISGRMTSL